MAPVITAGAISGSTRVSGRAIPNATVGNSCIAIFACAADACGSDNDFVIGTGSVDGFGDFVVPVTPLLGGQRIYPQDTCNADRSGPPVVVRLGGKIPDVTRFGATVLALSLLAAALVRHRHGSLPGTNRRVPP